MYAPVSDGRAEVAFATAAEYQGRGLATVLLRQLSDTAAVYGVSDIAHLGALARF